MTLILQGTDNSVSSPAVQGGTAGATTGVYYPTTNQLALATNGTLALLVDASQNVGIGTSSPSTYGKLAVSGTSAFGIDQTDYVIALGGGGTARVETAGSTANPNLALSVKGAGSVYFWRGGYGGTQMSIINQYGIGLSTATPSSGTGITFPATQSASSDANTLDDYEEGTWSPRIENAAGSTVVTLTNQGIYTKVGRMVHVQINAYSVTMTSFGTTEQMYLAGLPFTSSGSVYALTFNTYANQPVWILDGGASTKFPMYVPSNATDYSTFTRNTWGGSGSLTFRGNFVYEAS